MATTGGSDLEEKLVGQVSTIMRHITSEGKDLNYFFDRIKENGIDNTSLKQTPFNNHDIVANKCKIKGELPLEHVIGFCKTFEKTTKNLGFHLIFKTTDLQVIISATIGDDIKK